MQRQAHAIFRRTRYSAARKRVRLILAVGEEPVPERPTPVISGRVLGKAEPEAVISWRSPANRDATAIKDDSKRRADQQIWQVVDSTQRFPDIKDELLTKKADVRQAEALGRQFATFPTP